MHILARVTNSIQNHEVELRTGERRHPIGIPTKPDAPGSHPDRVRDLLLHTDTVTEIQKTRHSGCPISFQAG
jgi:hypothetical protein